MSNEPRVQQLLDEILHSERSPEEVCAQCPELLEEVRKRWVAILAAPAPTRDTPKVRTSPHEGPGTHIGPYKLLQQIGEGGFGIVYMAEQDRPVHRRVALKVIKPGMDNAQVIARFEAERQALAMMEHQNIARVFDAGTTETGRPYFVMELVHGVPITKYCDDNHLTPRERLELFVPICKAIQHAHQKGIIHRDLKPSNVLVCLYDGQAVAKVIDFGVAKAIESASVRLTDRTMFTQFGQIIGTFEYMSPEQAEMSQLGIDTRSDIYSLGVMLYELLTGTTPLSLAARRLNEPTLPEMGLFSIPPACQTGSSEQAHRFALRVVHLVFRITWHYYLKFLTPQPRAAICSRFEKLRSMHAEASGTLAVVAVAIAQS